MAAFHRFRETPEGERGELSWLPPRDLGPFTELPRDFGVGGLFWPSDGDPSGFRGQIYAEQLSDALGVSLYEPFDPMGVRALLGQLDERLARAEEGAAAVPLFGRDVDDGYALTRMRSLTAFVRAAAEQELWFYPDY
jgi:hypothetical protein